MKNVKLHIGWFVSIVLIMGVLCGCRIYDEGVIHDELFTYDLAYDKAYLKVLEAVDTSSEWDLISTDERKGVIIVQPSNYMRDDRVTILLTRVERRKTSVELAPDSQHIKGVEELLKTIDQHLMR